MLLFLFSSSEFGKNADSLGGDKGFLVDIKFCLATIGVCVFRASASVGALFYL